ncbi:MAG: peptidase, partial [Chloroflexota bacterium]
MQTPGYYRHPTIYKDTVIFVSEDDLWSVPAKGGLARRLTSNLGEVSRPLFSPDGKLVAFAGREEGQAEIYVMPARGGEARRLTYLGGSVCVTAGWTPDGKIIFASNAAHWHPRTTHLYTVDPAGGAPQRWPCGPARSVALSPRGGQLLGRFTEDPARWKRYRGGSVGQFWIDAECGGEYRRIRPVDGNLASPMWLGEPG